ncbi:hypothetical protein PHMEG_0006426 [Phytophthora megakarya]|uniref:Uncharacterized protein n=1 Tax=Phytophthora megakarya TaxID=4795 RepID=A0A225WPT7_9STRA|nr:hypothetical protein PHMEG_0006426 [Phytophthora megakarya]
MARQPPARVNSYLDQRLDSASTVQAVLAAAVAPHRPPPQEADELVRLTDEVCRLQTRCEDTERGVADEVQLRTAAEADSVRSTEAFYTVHDVNQDLRTENEELVARIRELDIVVAEQAHDIQRLKDRCRSSDADCAAAMRYVSHQRERMKAGLTMYNAEIAKLRPYLEEHDRRKGSVPPVTEISAVQSKASPSSGAHNEGSAEHSFIRPLNDSSVASSAEISVGGSNSGGLFDDDSTEDPPRKRKRLRQSAVVQSTMTISSKVPASRWLGRPSVDLKRKTASAVTSLKVRSGYKKARPSTPAPTGGLSPGKDFRSPPHPTLGEGEVDDDMGDSLEAEAPVSDTSPQSSSIPDVQAETGPGQGQLVTIDPVSSKSVAEVLDLTSDVVRMAIFVEAPPSH